MYEKFAKHVTIIAQDVKVSHLEKHVLPTFACLPSVAALALPGCHKHKRHKQRLLKLRLVTPAARVQHWCLPSSKSQEIRVSKMQKCCSCRQQMSSCAWSSRLSQGWQYWASIIRLSRLYKGGCHHVRSRFGSVVATLLDACTSLGSWSLKLPCTASREVASGCSCRLVFCEGASGRKWHTQSMVFFQRLTHR